jgi:hypothetical protein
MIYLFKLSLCPASFIYLDNQLMKFIEEICEKIVCPPKLRYSPYDLGIPTLIQARY